MTAAESFYETIKIRIAGLKTIAFLKETTIIKEEHLESRNNWKAVYRENTTSTTTRYRNAYFHARGWLRSI